MSSSRGHNIRSKSKEDGWEAWGGYINRKRQKLQQQFEEEAPDQQKKEGIGSKIFAGISIHVNGFTKPSSDELKRLMMQHGGNYEHYLYRTRVTHVIATNLPNSKVKDLKGLKVVRPEWITESIAEGRLLSYTNYLLYTAQSGLQKGLHTFTTSRENCNKSEESLHLETSNLSIDKCRNSLNNENLLEIGVYSDKSKIVDEKDCKTFRVISPGKTLDARDPKFLNEFYSNSRLHYLSTWKTEWKTYVNELQVKGGNFPGREELRKLVQEEAVSCDSHLFRKPIGKSNRFVMHIDMDCFFVSVGLRKRPGLIGKPVAVTHSKGKGQILDLSADPERERCQLEEIKFQGRRGKMSVKSADSSIVDESMRFPDQSDLEVDDNTETGDYSSAVTMMTTTESFNSMAEIASCSYEARQAGVKNGMFMGRARSLCPELVTIPYDFDDYKQVSKTLYDTVASFTHDIEAVSCDEMLVDCTDLLNDTGATPLQFATLLRLKIFKQTQCPSSAGIGSNILLAKMATRKAKPNGHFHLTDELVSDFIKSQSVKDLPGVGYSTAKRFDVMKVDTCEDLQKVSLDTLQKEFGQKSGQSLFRYCRGQDDRPIKMEQQRKSVSAEVNYGIRFEMDHEAVTFIEELSEEVCNRLKNIGMKGKTITLKLMVRKKDAPRHTSKYLGHGICNNFSKSTTLPMATDDSDIVAKETVFLLRSHKVEAADIRGIGIQIQKLELARAGCTSDTKKLPSILNYAVKQNCVSTSPDKTNKQQLNAAATIGLKLRETSKSKHITCKQDQENLDEFLTEVDKYSEKGNLHTSVCLFENKEDSADTVMNPQQINMNSKFTACNQLDLLQDLVSRQRPDKSLPPLPCLPDIKTPNGRKKNSDIESRSSADIDYFPSPSQIDPEVLYELPLEIREQIESEVKKRRKELITSGSSVACSSHWKDKDQNTIKNNQNESDGNFEDSIVDLPSPSQVDLSCLQALPENLQAELRQAYARQNSKVMSFEGFTTQFRHAKAVAKSPNRSPGKGSPNFKIPSYKLIGRKVKKGSSKKTLFKDPKRPLQKQCSTRQQNVPECLNITESTTATYSFNDTASDSAYLQSKSVQKLLDLENIENSDDIAETVTSSVNLCGAVTLQDVRHLLKEWITSTPAPQADDEAILKKYMVELVVNKNLEQVDLLLKYMLRNIKPLKDEDWLHTLKRIFMHTQATVQNLYGSELLSIKL